MPRSSRLPSSDGRLSISSRVYGWRGSVQDVVDRAELDQLAGVQDADGVGELGDQAHVVADQDDRRAEPLLDPAERHA